MFVKENVNPKGKKTTDCVVRAISKSSGTSYNKVLDLLVENMKKTGYSWNEPKGFEKVIESLGYTRVSCSKIKKGEKRPKVNDISKLTKGNRKKIICNCAGHLTCVEKGNLYDTWDCGDKAVYVYYIKE